MCEDIKLVFADRGWHVGDDAWQNVMCYDDDAEAYVVEPRTAINAFLADNLPDGELIQETCQCSLPATYEAEVHAVLEEGGVIVGLPLDHQRERETATKLREILRRAFAEYGDGFSVDDDDDEIE